MIFINKNMSGHRFTVLEVPSFRSQFECEKSVLQNSIRLLLIVVIHQSNTTPHHSFAMNERLLSCAGHLNHHYWWQAFLFLSTIGASLLGVWLCEFLFRPRTHMCPPIDPNELLHFSWERPGEKRESVNHLYLIDYAHSPTRRHPFSFVWRVSIKHSDTLWRVCGPWTSLRTYYSFQSPPITAHILFAWDDRQHCVVI